MHVLVVDDNEEVRMFVQRALERAGHDVHLASSGRGISDLIRKLNPDVLLIDVFMPDVDGIEVLRALRMHQSRVPVVMMSGGGGGLEQCLRMAKMLGAAAVLSKPIRVPDLVEALAAAVAGQKTEAGPPR